MANISSGEQGRPWVPDTSTGPWVRHRGEIIPQVSDRLQWGQARRRPRAAGDMTACGKMGAQAWTRSVVIRTRHPHGHQHLCLFCVQGRCRQTDKASHPVLSRRTAHLKTSQGPCLAPGRMGKFITWKVVEGPKGLQGVIVCDHPARFSSC